MCSSAQVVAGRRPRSLSNNKLQSSTQFERCTAANDKQAPHEAVLDVRRARWQCLEESPDKWKILCDTDGDQGFSDYTKIAHALCDLCVIPLKVLFQIRLRPALQQHCASQGLGLMLVR